MFSPRRSTSSPRALCRDSRHVTSGWLLLSPEERAIQTRDGDRDQFNREQHAADDGIGCGWREDEVHPQEFRCLAWWSFPGRKHDGDDQRGDHAIEHVEAQLLGRCEMTGRGLCGSRIVKLSSTMRAKPIDLRHRSMTGRTVLHRGQVWTRSRSTAIGASGFCRTCLEVVVQTNDCHVHIVRGCITQLGIARFEIESHMIIFPFSEYADLPGDEVI